MKKRIFTLLLIISATITVVGAQEEEKIILKVVDPLEFYPEGESVADSVSKFKMRRVDRKINQKKFIFQGEYMFGATMSYNSLSSDNAEFMLLLNNITADGTLLTVKPYVGYFYRNNRAVGARFGYSKVEGTINTATFDLGETNDIEMDMPYLSYSSDAYTYAIFHRAYAALDDAGHFGVFAEVELEASTGKSTFEYISDGELQTTSSDTQKLSLSFNPGISAFILHNVCASLSFEFGGLHYTRIEQYNAEGEHIGTREASKMQFMFNVFAINFGLTIHLW